MYKFLSFILFTMMFTSNSNIYSSYNTKIYLSFINTDKIDKIYIVNEVRKIYQLPVEIIITLSDMEFAYNPSRKQYLAEKILLNLKKYLPNDAKVLLAVVDKDLYTEGFNYIFGQSWGNVCIVSIYRFLPCSEIDTEEEIKLLNERTLKTIVHEIGHSFGLSHCKNHKCVMFFSNWVGDTDKKNKTFCPTCQKHLFRK